MDMPTASLPARFPHAWQLCQLCRGGGGSWAWAALRSLGGALHRVWSYPAAAWPHALPSCKWAGRGWLFLDEGECWAWAADHMAGSSLAFCRRGVEGQKLPLTSALGCWHRP